MNSNDTPLHLIAGGSIKDSCTIVNKLLEKDVNINAQNKQGLTALHVAIMSNNDPVFSLLLEQPLVDINLKSNDEHTPLYYALVKYQSGDRSPESYASRLIKKGAKTNPIYLKNGNSLLQTLIMEGAEDAAIFLSNYDNNLDHVNENGESVIHTACLKNCPLLVNSLLSCGMNANLLTNDLMRSPLHYAVLGNSADCIKCFIKTNETLIAGNKEVMINFNLKDINGDTPLSLSLNENRKDLLPLLMEGKGDINIRNSRDLTLLHQAILNEDSDTALFLLEHGADVNAITSDGETPLQLAIHCRLPEVVDALCSEGVDMSAPDRTGNCPLWVALDSNQENIASILVRHGADTDCWGPGPEGCRQTLLHKAIEENRESIAIFLIQSGCDLDSPQLPGPNGAGAEIAKEKASPLHMCCQWGLQTVIQALIEHGANIDSRDVDGKTPLHIAIENQHAAIINLLLCVPNIDLSLRDRKGSSPFATALTVRNNKAAQAILDRFPSAAEQFDSKGNNFLHTAIKRGDKESILFLLSIHVDVNSRVQDPTLITPLHLMAKYGDEMLVRSLIIAGARIEDRDAQKNTALHVAAEAGNAEVASGLIQSGIDVDACNHDGDNALHIAVREGHLNVVKVLLTESNIDAEHLNIKGRNPLHELCRCGKENAAAICDFFLECMPEYPINKPDLDGNTPLLLAYMKGNGNLCRILVKANACLAAENNERVTIFNYQVATKQLLYRLLDQLSQQVPWTQTDMCQECGKNFTVTIRKHHCRHCGRILCSKCSNQEVPIIKFGENKPVRVCKVCFDVLKTGLQIWNACNLVRNKCRNVKKRTLKGNIMAHVETTKLMNHLALLKQEYTKLQERYDDLEKKYGNLSAATGNFSKDTSADQFLEYIDNLYNSKTYSDLKIKLASRIIPGHKLVLNARSDFWNEDVLGPIDILDWSNIEDEVSEAILFWIYKDKIQLKSDDVTIKVIQKACEYKLHGLLKRCERDLITNVSVENCVKLYSVAEQVGAVKLKEYCSEAISIYWNDLKSIDFEHMSGPLLYEMLKSKTQFPLHSAVRLLREDVVFLYLVDNSTKLNNSINTWDPNGELPLDLALRAHNFNIASTLLQYNADINLLDSEGDTLLHRTIKREDPSSVLFILQNKQCDVSLCTMNSNDTPLHLIAGGSIKDSCTIVNKLLEKDVNINAQNKQGLTALHVAIMSNNDPVFSLLLEQPLVDINLKSNDEHTPLYYALVKYQSGDRSPESYASRLIKKGAKTNPIYLKNGNSLLQTLIMEGAEDAAIFLSNYDNNLDHVNENGESVIHTACLKNCPLLVNSLLSCGMNANLLTNDLMRSPLHYAVLGNSADCIKCFIKTNETLIAGNKEVMINFNLKDINGDTPLSLSLNENRKDLLPLLMEGKGDINIRNSRDLTLLHQAILNEDSDTALFLLEHGADVNAITSDGETPLQLAIHCRLPEVVDALCSEGVDMSAPDRTGNCPLWVALDSNQENIASILVRHGADTDCWGPGPEGCRQTLLHKAIEENRESIAIFLIQSGCDLDSPQLPGPNGAGAEIAKEKASPLHMCCQWGLQTVIQALIEHGANIDSRDVDGKTPLHIAIENQHAAIINLLLCVPNIDLSLRDRKGSSPFATALTVRNNKAAQAILDRFPSAAEQVLTNLFL
ncbi:rabankyrin-5, partial [Agrilus planipennis]|uniref:Rabankyrin-5 n=1 Tax=Agrilus planipennis TaxID=224129 RepID=A0A7F5R2A1_AGRPL